MRKAWLERLSASRAGLRDLVGKQFSGMAVLYMLLRQLTVQKRLPRDVGLDLLFFIGLKRLLGQLLVDTSKNPFFYGFWKPLLQGWACTWDDMLCVRSEGRMRSDTFVQLRLALVAGFVWRPWQVAAEWHHIPARPSML